MVWFHSLGIDPKIQVRVSGAFHTGGELRLCCTGGVGVGKIDAGFTLPSLCWVRILLSLLLLLAVVRHVVCLSR